MQEPIYRSTVRLTKAGMYLQYIVEMEISRAKTYTDDDTLTPVGATSELTIVATVWFPTSRANAYPDKARITMKGRRLPQNLTDLLHRLRRKRATKHKAGALWSIVEILAWHCIEKFQRAFPDLPIERIEQRVHDGAEFTWTTGWDILPDIVRSQPGEVELILECAPAFVPSMRRMQTDDGTTVVVITRTTGDA